MAIFKSHLQQILLVDVRDILDPDFSNETYSTYSNVYLTEYK